MNHRDPRPRTDVWWLTAEQYCEHCLQGHAVGLEVRCVACDETCCAVCAITVVDGSATVCPQCAREAAPRRSRR
jgi:hypothetical protein